MFGIDEQFEKEGNRNSRNRLFPINSPCTLLSTLTLECLVPVLGWFVVPVLGTTFLQTNSKQILVLRGMRNGGS